MSTTVRVLYAREVCTEPSKAACHEADMELAFKFIEAFEFIKASLEPLVEISTQLSTVSCGGRRGFVIHMFFV